MSKPATTPGVEERARSWWNQHADAYNQWDALGQDERDALRWLDRQIGC